MSSYPWWRHAVVYQVYIRSFADSAGDGTGDIAGLKSRLPYIKSLGVDAIWVNPWYASPFNDGGYDVADYRQINPLFGTIDEAKELIDAVREQGLRLLVDFVPNHTSSDHRWFQDALASEPGSKARARYHFLPGRGPDGSLPPNDWPSVFGGSAWTRVPDGEWYLHLFDVTQPDLNWANPEVRSEFKEILRFWLDLGASGFRVDVAHGLVKEAGYPDVGETGDDLLEASNRDTPYWDQEGIHEIVREWRKVADEYPDSVMIAEVWVPTWARLARYLRPGEYHQAFDFHFLLSPWSESEFRRRISEGLDAARRVGAIPTWVLSNHDVMRQTTRYALIDQGLSWRKWLLDGDRDLADDAAGLRRARAAALLMLGLPGSVYLYQGEELGLPEACDLPLDVLEDPVWEKSGHAVKGRDGCRVPIPWTEDGPSFGFGDGPSWLPQPEWWGDYAVDSQSGTRGSTLELYRRALRLRTERLRDDEDLEWVDAGEGVLGFRRSGLTCLVNFGDPIPLPDGEVLISSENLEGRLLPTDVAVWIAG